MVGSRMCALCMYVGVSLIMCCHSYGNASGPVEGVNLGILAAKGSLYVTRPTLATFIAERSGMFCALSVVCVCVLWGVFNAWLSLC